MATSGEGAEDPRDQIIADMLEAAGKDSTADPAAKARYTEIAEALKHEQSVFPEAPEASGGDNGGQ